MPVIPDWMRRLSLQTALLGLVCGGIIHIISTLVVPQFATASGVKRLADKLPVNRMVVLDRASVENQIVPFVGPDLRLAVCRFDVANGPVNVSAMLPDKGWSLGIYTMQGDNFYVVPATDFRRSEVSFQIMPPVEKVLGFFNFGRSVEASASQVQVAQPDGLIVLRAPVRGRAYLAETEAYLQRAQCGLTRG